MSPARACPLCDGTGLAGTQTLWSDAQWRVVRVTDAPDHPAFYRVIRIAHTGEWTDLPLAERIRGMRVVENVESVLRAVLKPTKVNLASLGNVVAHVHWHVIARFDWDSHFPQPIWGVRQREANPKSLAAVVDALPEVDAALARSLAESID
jgi:diadenosine tetraphosphate (Ap4A) HIT family hydrolase